MFREAFAAALILTGATACGDSEPDKTTCQTYKPNGTVVHPQHYPEADTPVTYMNSDYNDAEATGHIVKEGGRFIVKISDLPKLEWLKPTLFEESGRDVVLYINTGETGIVGATRGCITEQYGDNNIPETHVALPTFDPGLK